MRSAASNICSSNRRRRRAKAARSCSSRSTSCKPGDQAGDHCRAGDVHRRQLRRRAAVEIWLLGRLAGRAAMESLQRARRRQSAARSRSRRWRFLASGDQVLVCTHATFRFAVDELGVEAFDDRLIAVDEFHHVSANPDNKLGAASRRSSSRATRRISSP